MALLFIDERYLVLCLKGSDLKYYNMIFYHLQPLIFYYKEKAILWLWFLEIKYAEIYLLRKAIKNVNLKQAELSFKIQILLRTTKPILLSPVYLTITFHTFLASLILYSFNLKHTVINYKFTIWKRNHTKKLLDLENSTKLFQWTQKLRGCRENGRISVDGPSSITLY